MKSFVSLLKASKSSTAILVLMAIDVVLLCICMLSSVGAGNIETDAAEELSQPSSASNLPNKVNQSQLPDSSFIYDVSIEDLANADTYMDEQTVQVTGEVVGDRIMADGGQNCWITLQATTASDVEVLVFMSTSLSSAIDTYGAYGRRGTYLQARGTFNLACKDHDGVSGIHADSVTVVEPGYVETPDLDARKMVPGLAILLVGCSLLLVFNYLRERQR